MTYTGYSFITDRPLEDIPGFRCETDDRDRRWVCRGHLSFRAVCRTSYDRWYSHGFDGMDGLLNHMIGSDGIGWNLYEAAERHCEDLSSVLLFIYEYMRHGGHVILYEQMTKPSFHPELPVASVDVSRKGAGHTPMDQGDIFFDVLYHFYRSGPCAVEHDTSLLERMGSDRRSHRFGYEPSSPLTVRELRGIAGNSIGLLSIHDYDEAIAIERMNASPNKDTLITNDFCPLDMIMNEETERLYREGCDCSYLGKPQALDIFGDEEVMLYTLCFTGPHLNGPDEVGDGWFP